MRPVRLGRLAAAPPAGWRPVTYAEHQPEYQPLPVVRSLDLQARAVSRWRPTWRERVRLLLGQDVFLEMLTFNKPLTPVRLHVGAPRLEPVAVEDVRLG